MQNPNEENIVNEENLENVTKTEEKVSKWKTGWSLLIGWKRLLLRLL